MLKANRLLERVYLTQGGRGHWTANYSCTKILIKLWVLLKKSCLISSNQLCPNFSTNNKVIYIRSNFVYHHWGCILIYDPLSYPLIFLILMLFISTSLLHFKYVYSTNCKDMRPRKKGAMSCHKKV